MAILAAIALPNYADYVTRGKITEATTGLSDMRQRYEQFFLDTRSYLNGCATVGPLVPPASRILPSTAVAPTEVRSRLSGYTVTATRRRVDGRVQLFG